MILETDKGCDNLTELIFFNLGFHEDTVRQDRIRCVRCEQNVEYYHKSEIVYQPKYLTVNFKVPSKAS